jgi:hypothetical protein
MFFYYLVVNMGNLYKKDLIYSQQMPFEIALEENVAQLFDSISQSSDLSDMLLLFSKSLALTNQKQYTDFVQYRDDVEFPYRAFLEIITYFSDFYDQKSQSLKINLDEFNSEGLRDLFSNPTLMNELNEIRKPGEKITDEVLLRFFEHYFNEVSSHLPELEIKKVDGKSKFKSKNPVKYYQLEIKSGDYTINTPIIAIKETTQQESLIFQRLPAQYNPGFLGQSENKVATIYEEGSLTLQDVLLEIDQLLESKRYSSKINFLGNKKRISKKELKFLTNLKEGLIKRSTEIYATISASFDPSEHSSDKYYIKLIYDELSLLQKLTGEELKGSKQIGQYFSELKGQLPYWNLSLGNILLSQRLIGAHDSGVENFSSIEELLWQVHEGVFTGSAISQSMYSLLSLDYEIDLEDVQLAAATDPITSILSSYPQGHPFRQEVLQILDNKYVKELSDGGTILRHPDNQPTGSYLFDLDMNSNQNILGLIFRSIRDARSQIEWNYQALQNGPDFDTKKIVYDHLGNTLDAINIYQEQNPNVHEFTQLSEFVLTIRDNLYNPKFWQDEAPVTAPHISKNLQQQEVPLGYV